MGAGPYRRMPVAVSGPFKLGVTGPVGMANALNGYASQRPLEPVRLSIICNGAASSKTTHSDLSHHMYQQVLWATARPFLLDMGRVRAAFSRCHSTPRRQGPRKHPHEIGGCRRTLGGPMPAADADLTLMIREGQNSVGAKRPPRRTTSRRRIGACPRRSARA